MNASFSAAARQRSRFGRFAAIVAAAVLFKLWLTSDIVIVPLLAPHDASNFVTHAQRLAIGHWFGAYGDLTLIKGPFFPLYLAFIHDLGIPLVTAHVLTSAFACVLVCVALRPILRSDGIMAALFLFLFFDPYTYNSDAWLAMRSQINPALALACVGCAVALLVRRRERWPAGLPWAAGLALSFSAFWLTREEAVWLVPCLCLVLLPYAVYAVRRARAELWPRLALLAFPILVWLLAVNTVATINGAVYGWRTTTEMQAPEFVAAYGSLARLAPDHASLLLNVPRAAREEAYRVSPAARELAPFIESGVGANWRLESCRGMQICNDIGTPLFSYALRDAVSFAGHYSSGRNAQHFYAEMAREIDHACETGAARCARKRSVFLPAGVVDHPSAAIAQFAAGTASLIHLASLNTNAPPWSAPPVGLREQYEFVVRSVAIPSDRVFIGWAVHKPVRTMNVVGASDPNGTVIAFHASPDVAQVFGPRLRSNGFDTDDARFEISTSCLTGCALALTAQNGSVTNIPLSPDVQDFRNAAVIYHLDSTVTNDTTSFDAVAKNALIADLARSYRRSTEPLLIICALLLGVRLVRRRRGAAIASHLVLVTGIVVSIGALIAILSILQLLGVNAFNSEYMGVLFPLVFLAIGTTISVEGTLAYRALRRRLARRWANSRFSVRSTREWI
jgi:hypothetical protein